MHNHAEEVRYWIEHPDGTKIWYQSPDNIKWMLHTIPEWWSLGKYIVDDEWAELRKAQADGKQLQYVQHLMHPCEEKVYDRILGWDSMRNTSPNDWRIKSEEPIYEYQWICQAENGKFYFTEYYPTKEKMEEAFHPTKIIKRYEPSKRCLKILRKD